MKKLEKLNLKDVEELDTANLMSYSASGASGSNDGSGDMSFLCKDECQNDLDCGVSGVGVCKEESCYGFWKEKKCYQLNFPEQVCVGKRLCDDCRYTNDYGLPVDGKCSNGILGKPFLHCSTLNCWQ
jgi:hypothetical protein